MSLWTDDPQRCQSVYTESTVHEKATVSVPAKSGGGVLFARGVCGFCPGRLRISGLGAPWASSGFCEGRARHGQPEPRAGSRWTWGHPRSTARHKRTHRDHFASSLTEMSPTPRKFFLGKVVPELHISPELLLL